MLSISHAVTGVFIAVKIGNPVLAIPLIILSHYIEDAIPHWDVGTGLTKGLKSKTLAFRHEILDLALTGIFIMIMFGDYEVIPYWAALVGLLPDLLEAPRNFFKWEPAFLAPLNRFHHSFHHSIPRILDGLAPQLLLLILLWTFR